MVKFLRNLMKHKKYEKISNILNSYKLYVKRK